MLDKGMISESLNKFAKGVIQQSRSNLSKSDKNVSKKLYNSLGYKVNVSKNSFGLYFEMEDYGHYQDKGVSGVKVKYNTEYSYKDKMPPPSKLDKWIIKRGLSPRTKSGQFKTRKVQDPKKLAESIQWLIARSIYIKGIKPSLFFTKPFNQAFEKLPDELIEAYGLEVESLLKTTTK